MSWILFLAGAALVTIGALMGYAYLLSLGEQQTVTPYEIPQDVWDAAQDDRRDREARSAAKRVTTKVAVP